MLRFMSSIWNWFLSYCRLDSYIGRHILSWRNPIDQNQQSCYPSPSFFLYLKWNNAKHKVSNLLLIFWACYYSHLVNSKPEICLFSLTFDWIQILHEFLHIQKIVIDIDVATILIKNVDFCGFPKCKNYIPNSTRLDIIPNRHHLSSFHALWTV